MAMIKLKSSNGDVFETDVEIAKCSGTIKTMLEDCNIGEDEGAVVPLAKVNSDILRRALQWAKHHKDDPEQSEDDDDNKEKRTNDISAWDADFLKVDQDILFELILAANYLDMKDLLFLTCTTVANIMKGKTPEGIRETFNIKNDLSPAEEDKGEHRVNKMKLMDMNNDCLEFVLKFCNADSLVAASQTCDKLQLIATPLFMLQTSYNCLIKSEEDESRVTRTINAIGKHLTELQFRSTSGNYQELDGVFFDFLTQKCPNLQKLKVFCRICPNTIFDSVCKLDKLEHLTIEFANGWSERIGVSIIGLAHALKLLQSLEVTGICWNHRQVIFEFFREAKNLQRFSCCMLVLLGFSNLELDRIFFEKFRSSENPMAILDESIDELFRIAFEDESDDEVQLNDEDNAKVDEMVNEILQIAEEFYPEG